MDFYQFSSTTSSQTENYGADFTDLLTTGETIVSGTPVVSLSVLYGSDPTPASRLIGTPILSGNVVYQLIGNCIAETNYCILFSVNTNFNQVLTITVQLQCNSTCTGLLL